MKKITAQRSITGFTLIELLVVIGILAVLLAIVLIAINPARQFAQANNTARRNDVLTILNAVHQYGADNKGNLSALGTMSTNPLAPSPISNTTGTGIGNAFCTNLVTEYVAALPQDPLSNNGAQIAEATCVGADTWDTNYTIYRSATDNRITVSAPDFEAPETAIITVTR